MLEAAFFVPHPPVLVPEVGGKESDKLFRTLGSMRELAEKLKRLKPETLIFFTPHGNVFQDVFTYLSGEKLKGSLWRFGYPDEFQFDNDQALLEAIASEAAERTLTMLSSREEVLGHYNVQHDLDHGILVPLYFLRQGLPDKPKIAAISVAFMANEELFHFGESVRDAINKTGRRAVIVASGDLSHRLTREAPAGYNPRGIEFDQRFTEMIRSGDFTGILTMPPDLREEAGECGYRSFVMMLGCLEGFAVDPVLYSYEGPFGVGYCVAGFTLKGASSASVFHAWQEKKYKLIEEKKEHEHPLVQWARKVAESYVKGEKLPETPGNLPPAAWQKAGVFVSVKKNGQLRGCIGTISATTANVAEEIKRNAVAAVAEDPRFMPVQKDELPELTFSVDVLSPSEPVKDISELDPKKYGIIVESQGRRGLLLPDLSGVDTVEKQISIAKRKAGITGGDVKIERFMVERYE